MLADPCWRWVDWVPCYDAGDHSHGRKVMLMAPCPNCKELYLRAKGYGYDDPDRDFPHFDPDFKGAVTLTCTVSALGCGYQGDFDLDVARRRVGMVREVCSREV